MPSVRLIHTSVDITGNDLDQYFSEIVAAGSFDEVYFPFLSQFLPDDAVCIDIGANIGMVSLALSFFSPNGSVYSFEPTPALFENLERNIQANGRTNITPFQLAVAEKKKKLTFFTVEHYPAGNFSLGETMETDQGEIFGKKTTVQAVKLDDWVNEQKLKRLDFLKIDVEGAELRVLEGAVQTLKEFNPVVLMEFNSFAYITFQNITPTDAFKEIAGYFAEIYVVNRQNGSLERLEDSANGVTQFVTANLRKGFVDDILCVPKAKNLNVMRTLPQAPAPAQSADIKSLQAQLREKDDLIQKMLTSKRWRLVSMLRGH